MTRAVKSVLALAVLATALATAASAAGPGYDTASGLGTVDAHALAAAHGH